MLACKVIFSHLGLFDVHIKMLIIKGTVPAASNLQTDSSLPKNYAACKITCGSVQLLPITLVHYQDNFTKVKILVIEAQCDRAERKNKGT